MKKREKTDTWIILSVILSIIGVLSIFIPWSEFDGLRIWKWHLETKDYGLLGNFVNGICAPILALATILLIFRTYILQREELSKTSIALSSQRFENTFFGLLENHQRIVEAMDLVKRTNPSIILATKRDCFKRIYRQLVSKHNKSGRTNSFSDIMKTYNEIQNYYKSDLHHYFRFLYHILKFVKNNPEMDEEEKYKYTSILRAVLSPYELALIFYNCLHEFGVSHFKPLVEEFSFLKNLDDSLLIGESLLQDEENPIKYHDLAFASSEKRIKLLSEWKMFIEMNKTQ